ERGQDDAALVEVARAVEHEERPGADERQDVRVTLAGAEVVARGSEDRTDRIGMAEDDVRRPGVEAERECVAPPRGASGEQLVRPKAEARALDERRHARSGREGMSGERRQTAKLSSACAPSMRSWILTPMGQCASHGAEQPAQRAAS